MGANKLFIAETDMEYGRALARAISGLHNEFEIRIFSIREAGNQMKNRKPDSQYFDLFLIGGFPDRPPEILVNKIADSGRIVILSDSPVENLKSQSEKSERQYWYIYKYCNVNDIISDLNFLIAFITGKKRFLRKSFAPELIGFYSGSGGSGNTVCALGTSRELSRYQGKKVLYLTFEEMPATELFIKNNAGNRNIGDFLYYLFEKQNTALCSHPETFTSADDFGVEAFFPSAGPNDLNDLTQEELICLFKVLSDSCRYDYLVLDCNSRLSEETLFLLNLCSKIIILQNDNPISRFKHRKLMDYMTMMSNFNDKNRFLFVVNQAEIEESIENESLCNNGCNTINVEKDENSFRLISTNMHIDINHAFGIGMKKIADAIMSVESGKERAKCMENSVR